MTGIFSAIEEALKVLPGLILFPFSIYFIWKKIGQKVSVSYSVHFGLTSARRITNINITNRKDKPLTIFSMHAVINRDVVIAVQEFDPPLVLKSLESAKVKTDPYSVAHIGDDEFIPEFLSPNLVEIYIISNHGSIKCKVDNSPGIKSLTAFGNFRLASRSTLMFNDKVYNDRAKYAITYLLGSEQLTAIVDDAGIIHEDWDFRYNAIPTTHMSSTVKVSEYLKFIGFDKFAKSFFVDELDHPR